MTDKYNIDIVLNTFNQREESERKDSRILSESDPDILITKCVPSLKTFGETVKNQPENVTAQDNISSDDGSDSSFNGISSSQS